MQNYNWRMSDLQQRRLFGVLRRSSQRRMQRRFVSVICAMMLLALVLLLSGCQTPPTQQCETQPLPTEPALSEPVPSVSYSEQWRKLAQEWQKRLTFTRPTPEK